MKKIKFNFLSDQSVDEDLFDDQTHQKVANKIVDLIEHNQGKAVTIGLEGRWGSGKSTIIAIIKKIISKKHNNLQYFYIDAWAHEGDPLRRIILENIIQQADPDESNTDLLELKNILSKRKKKIITETKKAPTKTGCIIAILTLMIPFGAAMLSTIQISDVSLFNFSDPIHYRFIISLLFSLSPIVFIFFRFIHIWKKEGFKQALKAENWQFISEDSTDTITQEISEENERTSIEFEKYFYKIFEIILSNKNEEGQQKQIILVIDNLDRINAQDSLKIWSTIQTFLQYKNPSSSTNEITSNLWIIVPYDENGLGKLWDNNNYSPQNKEKQELEENKSENNSEQNDYIDECWKLQKRSFFDKCFQIRFEIPFSIQTSWENYARKLINISLVSLDEFEKRKVLKILINSRESLADIPSPREIKTYINQIGIQSMLSSEDITIECISYYVYMKYNKQRTQDVIKQGLLENNIPSSNHQFMLPNDAKYQLSGILFGTSQKRGKQLLLETPILEALNKGNCENLYSLYEDHDQGFWSIYDIVINKYKIDLLASIHAIYGKLWNDYELQPRFKTIISKIKKTKFDYPTTENYIYYQSLFKIFSNEIDVLKTIWKNMWNSFEEDINYQEFKASEYSETYYKICKDFPENARYNININSENLENWCKWSQAVSTNNMYVIPTEQIIIPLSEKIVESTAIDEKYISFMKYIIKVCSYNLQLIMDKIITYISWNGGTTSSNVSIKILDIIIDIAICGTKNYEEMKTLLQKAELYNFLTNKIDYHESFALLIALNFPDQISEFSFVGSTIGNSRYTLNIIKNIWLSNDSNSCTKLMTQLELYNKEEIIWTLPIEQNIQIINIIKTALNEEKQKYFAIKDNCYKKYKEVFDLLDSEQEKTLFTKFIVVNSPIEDSIINFDSESFFEELKYLYNIYIYSENLDKINDFYKNGVSNFKKDQWLTILKDKDLFIAINDLMNKVIPNDKLGDNFYQSMRIYINEWAKGDISPIEEVLNNWDYLILKLDTPFLERTKKLMGKTLWKYFEEVPIKFIELNANFFEFPKLDNTKIDKIHDFIEEMLNSEENYTNRLDKIYLILTLIQSIPIHENFNKVISASLRKHVLDSNDDKIKFVAKKLEIEV